MFSDSSLPWVSRSLDNSRWVGIANWADASDSLKWHQLDQQYNVALDLIWPEEETIPP